MVVKRLVKAKKQRKRVLEKRKPKLYRNPKTGAVYSIKVSKKTGRRYKKYHKGLRGGGADEEREAEEPPQDGDAVDENAEPPTQGQQQGGGDAVVQQQAAHVTAPLGVNAAQQVRSERWNKIMPAIKLQQKINQLMHQQQVNRSTRMLQPVMKGMLARREAKRMRKARKEQKEAVSPITCQDLKNGDLTFNMYTSSPGIVGIENRNHDSLHIWFKYVMKTIAKNNNNRCHLGGMAIDCFILKCGKTEYNEGKFPGTCMEGWRGATYKIWDFKLDVFQTMFAGELGPIIRQRFHPVGVIRLKEARAIALMRLIRYLYGDRYVPVKGKDSHMEQKNRILEFSPSTNQFGSEKDVSWASEGSDDRNQIFKHIAGMEDHRRKDFCEKFIGWAVGKEININSPQYAFQSIHGCPGGDPCMKDDKDKCKMSKGGKNKEVTWITPNAVGYTKTRGPLGRVMDPWTNLGGKAIEKKKVEFWRGYNLKSDSALLYNIRRQLTLRLRAICNIYMGNNFKMDTKRFSLVDEHTAVSGMPEHAYPRSRSSRYHHAARTKSPAKRKAPPKRKVYRNPKTGARYELRRSKTTGRMYKKYL